MGDVSPVDVSAFFIKAFVDKITALKNIFRRGTVRIMFKIDETVNYSSCGLCKIADIAKKDFTGKNEDYYVLKPVTQENLTYYVAVNNKSLTDKMYPTLSKSQIYEIIKAMPDEKEIWIDNDYVRQSKYKEILASGDRLEIVRMIKTLYSRKKRRVEKGKRLMKCDENFLREAEANLYNEFALVLDIKPDEVLPFIVSNIEVSDIKDPV